MAPPPMTPESPPAPATLRDLVGGFLSEQCDVLIPAGDALLAGEDVVHPTRVAIRRLRSTLRVFGDLVDVPRAGHLEDELVWWASLLGAVRDLDVLGTRLRAALEALPPEDVLGAVGPRLQAQLAAERATAMTAVTAALATPRYADLVLLLRQWRQAPPLTGRADRPAGKVGGYLKSADKRVHRRLAAGLAALESGDDQAAELLHRARKAAKRHRYALEVAQPVLGPKAERAIAARKNLQDVLGERQDAAVSAAFLRRLGAQIGVENGHNGFTYGVLYAAERTADDGLAARLRPFLG
ncbi:MAG: hypothetical protein JWP61_1506 [Friedmanniella sp.]|nr:hypothetical protein [Friedmanniella sp.]